MEFYILSVLAACTIGIATSGTTSFSPPHPQKPRRRTAAMQKQQLLQKATRVKNGRQLEDRYQQSFLNFEYYPMAFEVRFQTCIPLPSFSEQSAEIFQYSDEMTALAESGVIGAQQSFVLFDVCTSSHFSNPFSGNSRASTSTQSCDQGTYMIDLASWVDLTTNEDLQDYNDGMTYDEAYCEACAASYDFCQAGSIANLLALEDYQIDGETLSYFDLSLMTGDSSDSTYVYSNNGTVFYPKFTSSEGQLFGISADGGDGISMLVSCSVCSSRCSDYSGQDQVYSDDISYAEWAQEMSDCMETESYLDDNQTFRLYAGWMCSDSRSMIEPVMFLDDSCTIFEIQKDYPTAINETEYASVLNGAEKYMNNLFKEVFPLFTTPIPLSWADAFAYSDSIVEFVQGLGLDAIEQQYYEEVEQNGYDQQNDDGNGAYSYEDIWWQTLFQNWNLAATVDEDLYGIVQYSVDLATCDGTYGQIAYLDDNGTQWLVNASTVLYIDGNNDGSHDDLLAPCTVVSAMADDYSSINLVASSAYYSAEFRGTSSSSTGSNNGGNSAYYIHRKEFMRLTREKKIVIIVFAAVSGFLFSLWIAKRYFGKMGAPESVKNKQTPLLTEDAETKKGTLS